MEEESLAAALHTYRAQLEQVELSLRAGTDPTQLEDLTQLRNDLQQLIELTESSLLSVRKCKLLSSLEGSASLPAPEEPAAISSQDEEYEAFRRAIGEEPQPPGAGDGASTGSKDSEEEEEEEEEEEDGSSGMKVKAPYYSTWGTLEYHNAMVVGSEQLEDGEAGVRVLYLYPTHKAMKPCPFFLDGKCRFDDSCRFSHGQVVALAELQPFAEADVASLAVGSPCLAQHSDGIWYLARITDIESGFYTVKFDSLLLKESVLEADSIIPPLRGSDSSSSSDDDEEEDDAAEDSGYARVLGAGSAGSAHSSQFGGWEAHTRGIGSKLLARMGYEIGKAQPPSPRAMAPTDATNAANPRNLLPLCPLLLGLCLLLASLCTFCRRRYDGHKHGAGWVPHPLWGYSIAHRCCNRSNQSYICFHVPNGQLVPYKCHHAPSVGAGTIAGWGPYGGAASDCRYQKCVFVFLQEEEEDTEGAEYVPQWGGTSGCVSASPNPTALSQ
uniref:Zinc finger CCCH-type with G patch domain-containing protein n=1 Tax=Xenopus tropicalis TaxID=8364 RepID=A0A803J927_XENTR